MKVPIIIICVVCVLVNTSSVAEDADTQSSKEAIAKSEQLRAEARLNLFEARLNEVEAQLKSSLDIHNEMLARRDETLSQVFSRPPRSIFVDTLAAQVRESQDDATKGFIGVELDRATDGGVRINRVIDAAPAHTAGILDGDVITKVGDVDVTELDNAVESTVKLINSNPPGSIVQITLRRGDEEIVTDVATLYRSSIAFEDPALLQLPSSLQNIADRLNEAFQPESSKDVYIMYVTDTLAKYFGVNYGVLVLEAQEVEEIQPGDILLKIDDKTVSTVSQAVRQLARADDEFTIVVKRNKREQRIDLEKDQIRFQTILDRGR